MSQKNRVETAIKLLSENGVLVHGEVIPIERFEEVFDLKRDTQPFNWLISYVRETLCERGMWLSGEGLAETGGYQIVPPQENFYQAKLAMARSERSLARQETLLANTDMSNFSQLQVARHESTLRLVSLRLNALRKVQQHNAKISRQRKDLLEDTPKPQPEQDEQT